MMCTFSYGQLLLVSAIFYQLTPKKNQVHNGKLTHCRQTLLLINPLTPMGDQERISPSIR